MIALAIIKKEKNIEDYGYAALREAENVLQKMLDEKTKMPQFEPITVKQSPKQPFKEMTIAEFEKQELAKFRQTKVKRDDA